MKNKFISIIIPCYNEGDKLIWCFTELTKFLDKERFIYEIVFVDDGSSDNTKRVIRSFEDGDNWVKAISYRKNMGKGYAVFCGLNQSKYKTKLILDCDLSVHINELKKYNWNFITKYKIIKGHRQQVVKQPFYRIAVGKVWKLITYFFTGLYMDTQSPFMILNLPYSFYRRLKINGFAFDVEILYKAKLQYIKPKIIKVDYKNDLDSKVTIKKTMLMLKELYKIRIENKK